MWQPRLGLYLGDRLAFPSRPLAYRLTCVNGRQYQPGTAGPPFLADCAGGEDAGERGGNFGSVADGFAKFFLSGSKFSLTACF